MTPAAAARLWWRMMRLEEAAVREVADSRHALAYGAAATIIAGWARNYDRPDLVKWLWLGPLFSLGVGVGLSLLFYVSGRMAKAAPTPYRAFLSVFLFTAPLGWVYALPSDLLFGAAAHQVDFALLTVVSVWRLAVLIEAYKVLMGLNPWRRVLAALVPTGGCAVAVTSSAR